MVYLTHFGRFVPDNVVTDQVFGSFPWQLGHVLTSHAQFESTQMAEAAARINLHKKFYKSNFSTRLVFLFIGFVDNYY